MPRLFSTVLVFGLLAGTAAAFALTEGLKLEKTPVLGTQVGKVFSPTCRCPTRRVRIFFRLRKAETLTVTIERGGTPIRTLVGRARSVGTFRFTLSVSDGLHATTTRRMSLRVVG